MKKLLVIGVFIFGGYFVQSYISAGSAHKAFAKAVADEVHTIQVRWTEEEGTRFLTKQIRKAAEKHSVALDDDAIYIDYIRDEVSHSETETMWGTQTLTQYFVRVTATITYDRKVTPFYTKRITFSKSNREVRNWGV